MFAAIAQHLSFRKAAEERNVTPSSLSHAMRHFEERLGVRLLTRTTRKAALPAAGESVLQRIKPALAAFSAGGDDRNAWAQDPRRVLRLSVARSAAVRVFR